MNILVAVSFCWPTVLPLTAHSFFLATANCAEEPGEYNGPRKQTLFSVITMKRFFMWSCCFLLKIRRAVLQRDAIPLRVNKSEQAMLSMAVDAKLVYLYELRRQWQGSKKRQRAHPAREKADMWRYTWSWGYFEPMLWLKYQDPKLFMSIIGWYTLYDINQCPKFINECGKLMYEWARWSVLGIGINSRRECTIRENSVTRREQRRGSLQRFPARLALFRATGLKPDATNPTRKFLRHNSSEHIVYLACKLIFIILV